jgi:hypothetical protein
MKNFSIMLLILICLFLNVFKAVPTFAATSFNEGIYQLSDLNISQGNSYSIKNTSPNNSVYMILFDENQHELQSIHLSPLSTNYLLIPLQPNYRIVIDGDGEVTIA